MGNGPIRMPPWGLCPSAFWAGASVGVEEEVELAEGVTVVPLAPSATTAWLFASPIA